MSEFVKLTEYCDVNMGQSPASSSYNAEQRGIPFFQGNADFGNQNPHVRLWCNAPTKIAHCGDLLLSVRAPIGALNIADCTCCIGRGLAALTAKQKVCDPSWLYFALKSKISELQAQGTGSTFKAINKAALQNLLLPSCSLSEQQHIASVLRKVCCLITARQQQLTMLDQLAKSRFIEMFGDPIENPKGWKQSTIGAECYYIKDGPHKSPTYVEEGGIPFISTRNVVAGDGIDWQTAKYISEPDYQECIRKCHPVKGDILYSKGGTTGIARLVETDRKFANWVHVAVLKFGQQLNGKFFESMLNSRCCYLQSQRLTKGIANRDFVLSSIAQVIIIVPPLELQNEFAAFIEQLDKSKVICNKMHKMVDFSLFRV